MADFHQVVTQQAFTLQNAARHVNGKKAA